MKRLKVLISPGLVMMIALVLAACGTSAPANVSGLRNVVGTDLIGTKGATADDQHKINRTVTGICAASVWTRAECARHGAEIRQH
ncbi:hypothetical protein PZ897_01995 [Hoeflea sp. YIM 152468]|uniref:hypothetical protein n=1 Tax=Hoeflea sp. YIM 152468 TaxID=3031759 RepID=UPI0023DB866D|nr:hypothetical protein [Hoeflea sp. YIM 152468]MDF1606942.1 hypothetical protein [Hoeflea sp. YIM 152468]